MSILSSLNAVLASADVEINGQRPWDPQVHDERAYARILRDGTLGAGEAFMEKLWDVERLDELVCRLQRQPTPWSDAFTGGVFWHWLKARLFNLQSPSRAFDVGRKHYDIGNDLFSAMLDARMIYTCATWKDASTLDEAQEAKLDLVCRKLDLKPGQRILDIGCGWGGLMAYAAERYGATCVGISVSKEQTELGRKRCAGLPVEFVITDYRDFHPSAQFDHIVSIEMIEAVGLKNLRPFMQRVASWLKDDGRFILQTIATTHAKPLADPWIDRYIFPNGEIPNRAILEKAFTDVFIAHDWQNIGPDYDPTLMSWWENVRTKYPTLDHTKYDERFLRMWQFYLLSCAGGFRAGYLQDWQVVLTKPSHPPLKDAPR